MGKHTFQMHYRIEESRKCGNVTGRQSSYCERDKCKMGRGKEEPIKMDWNWGYWYELMISKISIWVYTFTHIHSYAYTQGGAHMCSVQSLSHVRLFVTPWAAARQASLSITNSQSLPKLMSIESVMPSNHLILCRPLLLLPSIFPSIRVFSNKSTIHIRYPKYWSLSFNISPSNEHPGLISFRMDWLISLQSKGLSRIFSNTTVQKHQFFSAQLSL